MAFGVDDIAAETNEVMNESVGESVKILGDGIGEGVYTPIPESGVETTELSTKESRYEIQGDGICEPTQIKDVLSNTANEVWNNLPESIENRNDILINDIKNNPRLGEAINKNPLLLEIYNNFIESKYRTELTLLRYGANNADVYRGMFSKSPQNRSWLAGKDLLLVDNEDTTLIINKGNGNTLGFLSGSTHEGFKIEIPIGADMTLTDMAPLGNCTYTVGGMSWKTDKFGRPVECTVTLSEAISESQRDKNFINKVSQYKAGFNINTQDYRPLRTYADDGGHIVADSWGGPSTSLNIVPQNPATNRGGLWKSSEIQGLMAFRDGAVVERRIKIIYGDNKSLRPIGFELTQTVNGKIQVIDGKEINNLRLEN